MRRVARSTLTAPLVALLVAACGGYDAPEADVVVAPRTLAEALASDRDAALAMYGGRLLELGGRVAEKIQPGGLNPTLGVVFDGIGDQLAFDANMSFVSFDSEDPDARAEFAALAVGDSVTLRCTLEILNETASLFLVNGCRVVP